MRPVLLSILLLTASNVFMTFAWYAHLKELNHRPWIVAALVSWGIAFFEYLLQVPANRVGYTVLSVGQLKLLQEVPFGHKVCIRETPAGADVLKYGQVIGKATSALRAGEYVHAHNVASARGRGDQAKAKR